MCGFLVSPLKSLSGWGNLFWFKSVRSALYDGSQSNDLHDHSPGDSPGDSLGEMLLWRFLWRIHMETFVKIRMKVHMKTLMEIHMLHGDSYGDSRMEIHMKILMLHGDSHEDATWRVFIEDPFWRFVWYMQLYGRRLVTCPSLMERSLMAHKDLWNTKLWYKFWSSLHCSHGPPAERTGFHWTSERARLKLRISMLFAVFQSVHWSTILQAVIVANGHWPLY